MSSSAPASSPAVIRARGLTRRYGAAYALEDVSFDVGAGEVYGIFGDNGAGKTTLLRLLAAILKPQGGQAWVGGHSVTQQPRAVRRLIGYVPQNATADPDLTASENLELYCGLYGLPRRSGGDRIGAGLALAGLEERRDDRVRTYSGGMRRRLEIARALLHQPPALLLDEPSAGLDPRACEAVWRALHELRAATGATVIVSTHRLAEDGPHCTAGLLLRRGKIVSAGRLDALRRRSAGNQLVRFRLGGGSPDWPLALRDVPGASVPRRDGAGWSMRCDDPRAACQEILGRALRDDVRLESLSIEEASILELLGPELSGAAGE